MVFTGTAWIHLMFLGLLLFAGIRTTISQIWWEQSSTTEVPQPWLHDPDVDDDYDFLENATDAGTATTPKWDRNEPGDEEYYARRYDQIKELKYVHSEQHCGDNVSYYVPETSECYRVFYCHKSLRYRWRSFSWSTCFQSSRSMRWMSDSVSCSLLYRGQLFDFTDSPEIKLPFAWWIAKKISQEMQEEGYMWSMGIGTRMDGKGTLIRTDGILEPQFISRSQKSFPSFRAYKLSPCLYGDICCLNWFPGIYLDLDEKSLLVVRGSCDMLGGGTHLCQKDAKYNNLTGRESMEVTDDDQAKMRDKKANYKNDITWKHRSFSGNANYTNGVIRKKQNSIIITVFLWHSVKIQHYWRHTFSGLLTWTVLYDQC